MPQSLSLGDDIIQSYSVHYQSYCISDTDNIVCVCVCVGKDRCSSAERTRNSQEAASTGARLVTDIPRGSG